MTSHVTSPLDVELHIPAHLDAVIAEVTDLYENEVAPRERALDHLLSDQSKFLDQDGRLHKDIIAARREIMAACWGHRDRGPCFGRRRDRCCTLGLHTIPLR